MSQESGWPQDQGLASQPSQRSGPVQSCTGNQHPGERLDQLLRSLLPLRVVLPCNAHQRTSRSMGDAEVQTTAGSARQGMGLARCCPTAPAGPLRPLAYAPARQQPICGGRMTGDCHVRSCESVRVRLPSATHQIRTHGSMRGRLETELRSGLRHRHRGESCRQQRLPAIYGHRASALLYHESGNAQADQTGKLQQPVGRSTPQSDVGSR